jgi:hypothetical protein
LQSAQEIYDQSVRLLPEREQLRVAVLILGGLTRVVEPPPEGRSMLELVESLPPGPRFFQTAAEVDRYIQAERDSRDR